MFDILDAIIATTAIVLGISLIVQAIQQIVKQWLDLKSHYMRFQLLAMFGSSHKEDETSRFYGMTRITKLMEGADPRAEVIVRELEAAFKSFGYKDLELLERMPVAEFQKIVASLPMFSKAKDEIKHVRAEIETWFDITKRSFQDLYERRMRLWTLIIGAVTVVVLNANIFEIYREFSTNKVVRDAAVAWAERVVSAPIDSVLSGSRFAGRDSAGAKPLSDQEIRKQIEKRFGDIQSVVNANGFQVLRWRQAQRDAFLSGWLSEGWFKNLAKSLLGWLGMILLVSLGAPFWYDILKTVVGFKNTVIGKGA
jgi:hypothetical protein